MKKYHLWLTPDEYKLTIKSLIKFRNSLLSDGKYTDAIDDLILKFTKLKLKKVRVVYKKK